MGMRHMGMHLMGVGLMGVGLMGVGLHCYGHGCVASSQNNCMRLFCETVLLVVVFKSKVGQTIRFAASPWIQMSLPTAKVWKNCSQPTPNSDGGDAALCSPRLARAG
jgi:hypothetical protein